MHDIPTAPPSHAKLPCSRPTPDTLLVELSGSWRLQDEFPALTDVGQAIEGPPPVQRMTFDTTNLAGWDSGLVTFLLDLLGILGGGLIGLTVLNISPMEYFQETRHETRHALTLGAFAQGLIKSGVYGML